MGASPPPERHRGHRHGDLRRHPGIAVRHRDRRFDIVIGDDDGLVIVPQALAAKTLEPCLAHVAAERKWEASLAHGATTIETFRVLVAIVDA